MDSIYEKLLQEIEPEGFSKLLENLEK